MDEPRENAATESGGAESPQWKPVSSVQRRVLGVLVEKAKTTPDAYPLTLNALTNGCNQKSNRSPQMNLSPDDVEEALEELRELGAVVEIQGGGRVDKFRHRLYDWLAVDKVELAVMAELLLRGEQTVGELRGRAARMEPIADVSALRPILRSLIERNLVLSLTPEGRGQIVTHNLYQPRELAAVKERVGAGEPGDASDAPSGSTTPATARPATLPAANPVAAPKAQADPAEVEELWEEIKQLKQDVEDLRDRLRRLEQ